MAKSLFITGTGTDVGKTYIAALIVKKLREAGEHAAYYKAAMSGNDQRPDGSLIPGDALWVREISGICQPLEEMCPYVYQHAVSPHLASQLEGNPVSMDVVKQGFSAVAHKYSYITVEGSGGILCPLSVGKEELWLEDVVRELRLPCIVVADAGLGTINHVVLTVEYMRMKGIFVKGLIFNHFHPGDLMEEDNVAMCKKRTGLPVLACATDGITDLDIDVALLKSLYE